MKVTIDNGDGQGPRDYSAALCPAAAASEAHAAVRALTVERRLNQPSLATGTLLLAGEVLPVPARRGRVVISSLEKGTVLFTGYLPTEPVGIYAGTGLAGAVYRYEFSAVSDEWLLDKQTTTLTSDGLNLPAGTLLTRLTNRTVSGLLSTTGVAAGHSVGVFTPGDITSWSATAGQLAGAACSGYRALNGALSLNPVGNVTHVVNFDSPGDAQRLSPAALKTAQAKELANDVTLTGEMEPAAFVTELFEGDGTTTAFTLADAPYKASKAVLVTDNFGAGAINGQLWQLTDSGSHLKVGAGGLMLAGGNGYDGQTTLSAWDSLELGGSLVLEAADVQLAAPSDGVLLGLYSGAVERDACVVGMNVRQSGGNTVITPYVNGAEVGTMLTVLQGHRYTFRIRLHCSQVQRVLQTYYARVDGAIAAFGGGLVASPAEVVLEAVDLGNASNTPATVLFDGGLASTPASCTFAPVNSLTLTGSIGSITAAQRGSGWVVSAPPGGAVQTRLIGLAGQGADCNLSSAGKLTFFAGRVPAAGELISVSYRTRTRSVARLEDTASVAAEAEAGLPGTARWVGKVERPVARCSADCEAAAEAVLALASSRSAAQAGDYACVNPADDVWPGDVLNMTSAGQTLNTVARKVTLEDGNAAPEVITYRVQYANDWAESLGVTVSEAVATDVVLPLVPASSGGQVIADVPQLAVVSTTGNALQIDAGVAPPSGGGFEVRLRDFSFGPGGGDDLVLRSPVRGFSIPRAAQMERYYVRMYDGSTPPLYSRHSSAVFVNLPLT